ncbi:MAG: PLD nuclease N-terminal domain-containing protein [Candidatus Methanoperedens sp.]
MNHRINVILIVFFIFFVNTDLAAAIQHEYVPLTVSPGDEITRTTSFTGAYKRLFATVEASGSAVSWVTPRRIDFGTIDPGDISKRDYTIKIPRNQNPGYYELIWKFSCRYTDGTACTVTSDTVLQITVKAKPASTTANKYMSLTLTPGEEQSESLEFSAPYGSSYAWADASGNAASWVAPRHVDFGIVDKGKSNLRYYTVKVPENQYPGYYEITWKWGCKYVSGETCSVTGDTVIQITVEANPAPIYTKPRPIYTPTGDSSTTPVIIGITFILILFIVWIYVFVWVARDANKRGTSGTLWGFLAFFSGLFGLLVYLIFRPKGNFVLCDYCGNEKLERLTRCPHCKKAATPAFEPTPTFEPAPVRPKPITYPAVHHKPKVAIDDLNTLKERLSKINELLDKLDERVAQGEITEAKYKELSEKYRDEADSLKNMITEKDLMQEVGLKGNEE